MRWIVFVEVPVNDNPEKATNLWHWCNGVNLITVKMLSELKNFLKEQKVNFFLLPNSDEFFSEYLPESEKRIQYLTGFTGSAATVIFGENKSYFFTDGRYILQAKQQLDLNEFEIFNIAEKPVMTWILENCVAEKKLALDPKLASVNFIENCKKNALSLVLLDSNPVDQIWQNRCAKSESAVFTLEKKIAGVEAKDKIVQILQALEADAQIITKPENVCWLLNIRGRDLEFTPTVLTYALLFKNGKVELFKNRIPSFGQEVTKIQIDKSTTNYWLYSELQKDGYELIHKIDPIDLVKSQKNLAEIEGAIKSHQEDGLAVTKFLFWLSQQSDTDEILAAKKLLDFRRESKNFVYESFAAISGFASNGAVIHYHATEETNKKINGDSLYLIDSGGQYLGDDFCGTTDVTRTIAIGTPTAEMIENFTRVLKGHIALARAKFPRGTSGAQLDVLAREHLWRAGLDYDHGTGHGVGSFLSVHEGPCGISRRAHQELLPGMILSNEPGFYKNGEYGIRIENLMLVEESNEKFLQFCTLTLVPLDPKLIDFSMLTYPEKKWLKNYHQKILQILADKLSSVERLWLNDLVKIFSEK